MRDIHTINSKGTKMIFRFQNCYFFKKYRKDSQQKFGGRSMQSVLRTVLVVAVLLAFAALSVVPGYAQTSNGVIAGVIVDNSGAVVLKATIEATSSDRGGAAHVTETDSSGSYRIESLLPGTYSLVVKKTGFAEIRVSGLEVKASLTTTFNGTLELAGQ